MKHYLHLSSKIFISIVLFIVLTAGCTAVANGDSLSLSAIQQPDGTTRTVQVTGIGESQVEPDTAVINLGIQTQEKTAEEALQNNNAKMQALIKTLENANIPARDIQTQTIRLSPRYELNNTNNSRTLVGYTASNIVEVRTQNLESLGTLLDQAVKAGANTIENINFEVSNSSDVVDQVRESAIKDAQHKAEELASLTGTKLGPVLEIQESSSTPSPIVRQVDAPVQVAAVPVSPGTQSITVQVQVTWTLIAGN